MIDTNQLLTIGFALLAHFTNVVHMPPEPVPQSPNDLQQYRIGSPNSPTDLFLVDRAGANYWISGGIVKRFGSLLSNPGPKRYPVKAGESAADDE